MGMFLLINFTGNFLKKYSNNLADLQNICTLLKDEIEIPISDILNYWNAHDPAFESSGNSWTRWISLSEHGSFCASSLSWACIYWSISFCDNEGCICIINVLVVHVYCFNRKRQVWRHLLCNAIRLPRWGSQVAGFIKTMRINFLSYTFSLSVHRYNIIITSNRDDMFLPRYKSKAIGILFSDDTFLIRIMNLCVGLTIAI